MKNAAVLVAFALAVIAAAIAGIVVVNQKAAIARSEAETAMSREEIAAKEAKKAEAERVTAAQNAREAELKLKTEETVRKTAEAEAEKARLEAGNLAAQKVIRETERETAAAAAKKAADEKAAIDAALKAESAKLEAERAKLETAAAEAQKALALQAAREAEVLKLKVSMAELNAERERYDQLASELVDYKLELDERERALHPDKTIADLSWIGMGENGNDTNELARAAAKTLPENDPLVPRAARELSKTDRLRAESAAKAAAETRDGIVAEMEAMIRKAYREDRIVEARAYSCTLKSIYPDWKLAPEKPAEEEKKQ